MECRLCLINFLYRDTLHQILFMALFYVTINAVYFSSKCEKQADNRSRLLSSQLIKAPIAVTA
jgi:hypothetical protein